MPFSDKIDMREPYCLTEFANDIFLNLRLEEGRHALKSDYLSKM